MKLTLEEQYILCILHSQCHVWWCTGDVRSQCISMHGIDPPKLECSVSTVRRVKTWAGRTQTKFMEVDDSMACATMTLSCRSKNKLTPDLERTEFIPGLFINIMDSLAEVPILFPLCKMTDCQCQLVDECSSCCTYSSVPQWYYWSMLWNPHNSATGTTNGSMTVIVMFLSIFKIWYFMIFFIWFVIEWIIMVVILSLFFCYLFCWITGLAAFHQHEILILSVEVCQWKSMKFYFMMQML